MVAERMGTDRLATLTATRARLVSAVVATATIPLIALAIVSMQHQEGAAIDEAFARLDGIATAQVGNLEQLVASDQELAQLLASNQQLRAALQDHAAGRPVDPVALEQIVARAMASSDRLINICLHSIVGDVVLTGDASASDRYDAHDLRPGQELYTSRILGGPDGSPTALTSAAVVVDGIELGHLSIETDSSSITSLATDYTGMSLTGETSIAQATAEGAQLIAPLRFRPNAVLNMTVPSANLAAPITQAMAANEGRFEHLIDYRDVEVLAVTRYVDDAGWGVVAKIDRSEALQSIGAFRETVWAAVGTAIALVLLLSIALSRSIWGPIRELTEAATAVALGDRSRRAKVLPSGDFALLAKAVNVMTDELVQRADADADRHDRLEGLNTKLTDQQHALAHQANHDALTGLPNRSHLQFELGRELDDATKEDRIVGLLFVDLDRFKVINDSRGHAAGDRLLCEVADRLTAVVRSHDMVARFGGDEFVILVTGDDVRAQLDALPLRVHEVLAQPFGMGGDRVDFGCSIGVAISRPSSSADGLISDADVAMYRAKATGRDRTAHFDQAMRTGLQARHEMEGALRRAIELDEIDVHFQPIVDLRTGEIAGVETLARWNRPGFGPVSPDEFINVAEETGLIIPLGRAVFRAACEQQARWLVEHPGNELHFAVNVSARELSQSDWVDNVRQTIRETGARATAITIELTETALSSHIDVAAKRLADLRSLGVSVSVDDFGTGYSSLTYLRDFPIDVVKIDRAFMSELQSESVDSTIVALVLDLGRNLGLRVVAEGVETEAQLAVLKQLDCHLAQGYLFAPPQPASELSRLLWPRLDAGAIAEFAPRD